MEKCINSGHTCSIKRRVALEIIMSFSEQVGFLTILVSYIYRSQLMKNVINLALNRYNKKDTRSNKCIFKSANK